MSERRICDLHGAIIDEGMETYYTVTDSSTGRRKDICSACARSHGSYDAWAASTALNVNDRVAPTAGTGDYVYRVVEAGTTDGTEPTWPATFGEELVDGTVTYVTDYSPRSAAIVHLDIAPVAAAWRTLYEWMNGITTEQPDGVDPF